MMLRPNLSFDEGIMLHSSSQTSCSVHIVAVAVAVDLTLQELYKRKVSQHEYSQTLLYVHSVILISSVTLIGNDGW